MISIERSRSSCVISLPCGAFAWRMTSRPQWRARNRVGERKSDSKTPPETAASIVARMSR